MACIYLSQRRESSKAARFYHSSRSEGLAPPDMAGLQDLGVEQAK